MIALLDDPLALALGQVVAQQDKRAESDAVAADLNESAVGRTGSVKSPRAAAGTAQRVRRNPAGSPHGPEFAATGLEQARDGAPEPPASGKSSGAVERRALESAALALLVRSFAPVVHELPVAILAGVLATGDPTTAAAALTATLATDLSARAAATPFVQAWFESARRKRELLEEANGGLTATQVARVRGVTRQAVERARVEQRLLAVPASAVAAAAAVTVRAGAGAGAAADAAGRTAANMTVNDWLYPAAQFGPDGHPLPGLVAVLRAFQATHVVDPWTRLSELLAPDPELGDRSILALLREEGEAAVPAAVAALREVGAMGA